MKKYEAFHINEHKAQYNGLPRLNLISGFRVLIVG